MPSNNLRQKTIDIKHSNNRLLVVDWGSLSYHQLYAIEAIERNKSSYNFRQSYQITSAEEEVSAWKSAMVRNMLEIIRIFNPMDIIIALEGGTKTWRHGYYRDYYLKNHSLKYNKKGFYLFYDNDVLHIEKSEFGEVSANKIKKDIPEDLKDISLEKLKEDTKNIILDKFPEYKGSRKSKPWEFYMTKKQFNELRDSFAADVSKFLRCKVICSEMAEGDDVIYQSCIKYKRNYDSIVMVTRDSDMNQMLNINNLVIYNHLTKELATCESPTTYLDLKVLSGDTSDSIPGIALPGKKTKLGPAGAEKLYTSLNESCLEAARNGGWLEQYERNRTLIDLSCIPTEIRNDIDSLLEAEESKFCPFWEISKMGFSSEFVDEISTMKNSGFFCLNEKQWCLNNLKEQNKYNPKVFDNKVTSRVGNSSDYNDIFNIDNLLG